MVDPRNLEDVFEISRRARADAALWREAAATARTRAAELRLQAHRMTTRLA